MRFAPSILSALIVAILLAFGQGAAADELKDISQLAGQGQLTQALDRINSYIDSNPKDVQGQFLKGVILAEQNKSAEAIKIFTGITEKHPELPEPYNNLAVLYADQGQYEKARRALEMAIKTHPSYATAHENLGDIYAKMASDAYDKALQLDKGNARAQTKLAMVKELFTGNVKPPAMTIAKADAPPRVTPPAASPSQPSTPASMPAPAPAPASRPATPEAVSTPAPDKEKADADIGKQEFSAAIAAARAWAKAWSAEDADAYLSHYAPDFKTPNGESRNAWEKSRRSRIKAAGKIHVELSNMRAEASGKDRVKVSFRQRYEAGNTAKRTQKTLEMVRKNERWLILQEITDR
ncbi:MAG: tetratricopeptide repeat protein [Methylobacterium sp.]|nr:tetratricopeptide repeat protein [Methylobacterium sp.]